MQADTNSQTVSNFTTEASALQPITSVDNPNKIL